MSTVTTTTSAPSPTSPTSVQTVTVSPGYKTSEFWLSTAAVILGVLMTSGIVTSGTIYDKAIGAVVSLLAALGYTYNRSNVKSA